MLMDRAAHERRSGTRRLRVRALWVLGLLGVANLPGNSAFGPAAVVLAETSTARAIADLRSPDADTRLAAARALKQAAPPDAAVPLAPLLADPDDAIQLEAIGAEVNIFLARKIVPRRRVALVVEVRNAVVAQAAFDAGPWALGALAVPTEALAGLRRAMHDDTPRVALEALYAYGALAGELGGAARRAELRAASPDLASRLGILREDVRLAALRVIGRVFARRAGDEPVDALLGDAIVGALNDPSRDVQQAAARALGALRYERSIQALVDRVPFDSHGAGIDALDALAHVASAATTATLLQQLGSADAVRRRLAIEGLARVGEASRWKDVDAVLAAERDEAVLLAGHFAVVALAGGRVDAIVESLRRPRLRGLAFGYLVELAPGRVASLVALAQDPDPQMRADCADVLGLSGEARALPTVDALAMDAVPDVARAAARAARRLRAAV